MFLLLYVVDIMFIIIFYALLAVTRSLQFIFDPFTLLVRIRKTRQPESSPDTGVCGLVQFKGCRNE